MKFGTSIPLDKGNMPAKFGPDRPPNGELCGLKMPKAPILTKCVYCGQTVWPISFIFGRYLPLNNGNSDPKGGTLIPQFEFTHTVIPNLRN